MNKTRKAIALVLASGLSAGALAQGGLAGEQGPYVGIGYQSLSADLLDVTLDTGQLIGGWKLSPYFSLEASYTRSFGTENNTLIGINDVRIRQGWIGSAIGSLPISDNISAYARVGWGWHRLSANFGEGTEKTWVDDPVFGAGVKANISPMSEIRAEWTRLFDDSDINATGISFTYIHHLR